MHLLIYGPGRLGGAIARAAADAGWTSTLIGRPDPTATSAPPRPRADVVVEASAGVGGRRQPRPRAGGRQSPVRPRGQRLGRRDRPRPLDAARARRCRRRRAQPVARGGAVPAPGRAGRRHVRARRASSRRSWSGTAAARPTARPARRATSPAGSRPRTPAGPGPTSHDDDRPALEVVGIRAGVAPGTHLVTFDGPGESVELRLTARDRTAYADGALAAARWLVARSRAPRAPPVRCRRGRPPRGLADRRPRLTRHPTPDPRPRGARPMTRTPAPPRRLHRARDPVHRRRHARRGRLPPPRHVAGHGRHRRPRPGRHHRRVAHAHRRGARPVHRDRRRDRRRSAPAGAGSRSSPAPAPTTPARPSRPPGAPPPWAPTPRSSSRPTTTSPTSGCSTPTSGRSRTRAACRSSSTTSPAGPAPTSRPTRSCAWPSTRGSIAVKEASANIEQIAVICRDRPRDVAVLSGDDAATLAVLAMGGDGVISVASNEIPGEMAALVAAAHAGDWRGGAPPPRPLPAAAPRELPGRPEPGAGEGRDAGDGPARRRHAARAAAAAGRRAARAAGRAAPRARPRGRRRAPADAVAEEVAA